MVLHRLTSVTMGQPNVPKTSACYTELGLQPLTDGWFTTRGGGPQLHIVVAPTRRLVELHFGLNDHDDHARAADTLTRLGIGVERTSPRPAAVEKVTEVRPTLEIASRPVQHPNPATVYNGPGRLERQGQPAPGILPTARAMPRQLGRAVQGTTDLAVTKTLFADGLGFKISDRINDAGVFVRCSRTRTSSGTSRTPPETSVSTTPRWTASSMTSSGRRRSWKKRRGVCSIRDRRRHGHSWHLTTSAPL